MASYDKDGVLRDRLSFVSRPLEKAVRKNEYQKKNQNKEIEQLNTDKTKRIQHLNQLEADLVKQFQEKGFIKKPNKHSQIERMKSKEQNELEEAISNLKSFTVN